MPVLLSPGNSLRKRVRWRNLSLMTLAPRRHQSPSYARQYQTWITNQNDRDAFAIASPPGVSVSGVWCLVLAQIASIKQNIVIDLLKF